MHALRGDGGALKWGAGISALELEAESGRVGASAAILSLYLMSSRNRGLSRCGVATRQSRSASLAATLTTLRRSTWVAPESCDRGRNSAAHARDAGRPTGGASVDAQSCDSQSRPGLRCSWLPPESFGQLRSQQHSPLPHPAAGLTLRRLDSRWDHGKANAVLSIGPLVPVDWGPGGSADTCDCRLRHRGHGRRAYPA